MAEELETMRTTHDKKVAELTTQHKKEVDTLVAKLADAIELVKQSAN